MTDLAASPWSIPVWPAFGLAADVRPALAAALAAGRPCVLASLYAVDGAAPLGQGAQMLFDEGPAAGFLSGGCVEGDVALHAHAVLEEGRPRRLVYGRGGPPDIQLLCGARVEMIVERIGADEAAAWRLIELGRARRAALWLSDGEARVVLAEGEPGDGLSRALRAALAEAERRTAPSGEGGGAVFHRFAPVFRMMVIGGDPIALATASLAAQAGFETALARPKGPAEPPPLPGVRYFRGEASEALAAFGLDPWTAVAVATHDLEVDHGALMQALPSPAGYVGALGSRRRLPERLERLKTDGLDDQTIGRLKAPIGIAIGARTPWQIAVSVTAEAIQALQGQDARRPWPAALEAT